MPTIVRVLRVSITQLLKMQGETAVCHPQLAHQLHHPTTVSPALQELEVKKEQHLLRDGVSRLAGLPKSGTHNGNTSQ